MRAKYCVPFRTEVAPYDPVSIMGVAQGRFCVAAVPQLVGKISRAVFCTEVPTTPDGRYVVRICVPTVFAVAGLVVAAQLMNSGAGKVTDPPALEEERSGSTAK